MYKAGLITLLLAYLCHLMSWDTALQRIFLGRFGHEIIDHVDTKRSMMKSLHDTEVLDMLLEDPDIYYEEDTGRWIWAAASTAPRDALSSVHVHAWLHVIVDDSSINICIQSFGEFLRHYVDQGMELNRVIFDIHMVHGTMQEHRISLERLISMVEHVGAEYSMSYIQYRSPGDPDTNGRGQSDGYRSAYPLSIASLIAVDGIPLHDWIITVQCGQLVSFKEDFGSIHDFIHRNERNGANCVASKHVLEDGEDKTMYVAMKGYLRSNANRSHVFDLQEAEDYFGESFEYIYTPYHTWWEFYKSPKVLGNAYLWYPRRSDSHLHIIPPQHSKRSMQ